MVTHHGFAITGAALGARGDDLGDEAADRAGFDDALVAELHPSQAAPLVQFNSDRHNRLAARAGRATCVFATSDERLIDLDYPLSRSRSGRNIARRDLCVHAHAVSYAEPEEPLQAERGDAFLCRGGLAALWEKLRGVELSIIRRLGPSTLSDIDPMMSGDEDGRP